MSGADLPPSGEEQDRNPDMLLHSLSAEELDDMAGGEDLPEAEVETPGTKLEDTDWSEMSQSKNTYRSMFVGCQGL